MFVLFSRKLKLNNLATEKGNKVKAGKQIPTQVSAAKDANSQPIVPADASTKVTKSKSKKIIDKAEEVATPSVESLTEKKKATKVKATDNPKSSSLSEAEVIPSTDKKVPAKKSKASEPKIAEPKLVKSEVGEDSAPKLAESAPVAKTETKHSTNEGKNKKSSAKKLKLTFQLKYSTRFGQKLLLCGNHNVLGNDDLKKAITMEYFNHEFWFSEVEISEDAVSNANVTYNYYLVNEDGSIVNEKGSHIISSSVFKLNDVLLLDTWSGDSEDATVDTIVDSAKSSHIFKTSVAELPENLAVFISGNVEALGNWSSDNVTLLQRSGANQWSVQIDLNKAPMPVAYKYGIYDTDEKKIVVFESGADRIFYGTASAKDLCIISDGEVWLGTSLPQTA